MKRCEHKRYTFRKGRISLFYFLFSPFLSLSHTLSSSFLSALHFFLFSASLSHLLLLLFFCFSLLHVELVRHRMPHLRFLHSEPRIAEDHLTVVTHKSPEITSTEIAGSHPETHRKPGTHRNCRPSAGTHRKAPKNSLCFEIHGLGLYLCMRKLTAE